ncbi:MAG: hypothetical protein ACLFM6_09995 [Spirochaetaceae bacterium]
MGDLVPREKLERQGMTGIVGTGAGLGLLLLRGLTQFGAGFSLPGLIIGGVLAIAGAGMSSGKKADRIGAGIVAGGGILTAIASLPIVGGLASGLMWVSGVGLLGTGVVNLFRFARGLRGRR